RRRHTRFSRDWSSDVCSSDLGGARRAHPAEPTPCPSGPLRPAPEPPLPAASPRWRAVAARPTSPAHLLQRTVEGEGDGGGLVGEIGRASCRAGVSKCVLAE